MTGCPPEHDPKELQATVESAGGFDLDLAFRPMFGGIMGYAGGRPFASLSNRGLALKLDAKAQEELLALGGARLQYEPIDQPSRTYVLVPEPMLADGDALRAWLKRSAAFVAASPARKPKAPKPRKD